MTYSIIGAGRFGRKAVQRLFKRRRQAHITVVDTDQSALESLITDLPVEKVCQDGAAFLTSQLNGDSPPDWIVPAVPIHLAFQWVCEKVRPTVPGSGWEIIPVPEEVESMVPNPMRGSQGGLYMSFAYFLCPDHCMEPYDRCTFTGKPRKGILYQMLKGLSCGHFTSVVVRSRQLAPGVGGFRPEDLKASLEKVLHANGPVLYSTACFCHGVMNALRLSQVVSTAPVGKKRISV